MAKANINPSDYYVLVCDDEESIRGLLAQALGGWGFQVATSPNAEAAMEYIKAGNMPHILLTDIRMGDMNGIELAAEVKKLSEEVEVVIMTSHGTFETAVQAMKIGVFDYISKPFDNIEDVRVTLEHVAERIYLRLYNEFLLTQLEKKNREILLQSQMAQKLAATLDLAETLEVGVRAVGKAFGDGAAAFFQYVPSQKALIVTTRSHAALFGGTQAAFPLNERQCASQANVYKAIVDMPLNPEFLKFVKQAMKMTPAEAMKSLKITPGAENAWTWKVSTLLTREIPRGVIVLLTRQWEDLESTPLLSQYVRSISTSFENALLHAKVVQTAIRDSMTGLYNVRFFKERFIQEILTANRLRLPVSLLFFDVDHFKKYNDAHGHPAGDVVLKMVAEHMRSSFRNTDVLARYGGEEFVALLPHTAFVDALEKAEGFRKSLEELKFPNEHTQPLGKVTVSIGVAEFPSHGSDMDTVIKMADDALYEAKKKSRNVVVPAHPPEGYLPAFESKSVRTRGAEAPPKKT